MTRRGIFGFGKKKDTQQEDFDKKYEEHLKKKEKEVEIKDPKQSFDFTVSHTKPVTPSLHVVTPFDEGFEGGISSAVSGMKT